MFLGRASVLDVLQIFLNIIGCFGAAIFATSSPDVANAWLFWLKAALIGAALHSALLIQRSFHASTLFQRFPMILTALAVLIWMWLGRFLPVHVLNSFGVAYILLSISGTALVNWGVRWWASKPLDKAYFFGKSLLVINIDTAYGETLIPLLAKMQLKKLLLTVSSPMNVHAVEAILTRFSLSAQIIELTDQTLDAYPIDSLIYITAKSDHNLSHALKSCLFDPLRILRAASERGIRSVNLLITPEAIHKDMRFLFEQIMLWLLYNDNPHMKVALWYVGFCAKLRDLRAIATASLPFAFYTRLSPSVVHFKLPNVEGVLKALYQASIVEKDDSKIQKIIKQAA